MTEKVIEAVGLTKRYGDILAVDGITFEVGRGEIFGFLGPNGAGKTTTIRMLTSLSIPTSGRARVLGYDVASEVEEVKRRIGVVPEASNLYDELSGVENLLFIAGLMGVPRNKRRERAERLLKIFGLYERRAHLFGTYSRGMKRALTIAAALIHEPELLFLDEPTAGLDIVAARSLRRLVEDLNREGVSIFLTTHYLEEADQLCDRMAIIVKGRIKVVDTPERLKTITADEPAIEISFRWLPKGFVEELSGRLKGLRVIYMDHGRVRVYGGSTEAVLGEVLECAGRLGAEVEAVNSVRPKLEDAFVKITGLKPEVMAVEKGGRR